MSCPKPLILGTLLLFVTMARAEPPASQPADGRTTVFVLPFESPSGNSDQGDAAVAKSVRQNLVADLSRSERLHVIESKSEKAEGDAAYTEAKDAGAAFAVRGTIQQAEGRLRVTGELLDVGGHASAGRFRVTGSSRELFEIQDLVVDQVRSKLSRALSKGNSEEIDSRTTGRPAEVAPSEPLAMGPRAYRPDWMYTPERETDDLTYRYNYGLDTFSYWSLPYVYGYGGRYWGYGGYGGYHSPYYARLYRPYRPVYTNRFDDYTYRGLPDRRFYQRDYGPRSMRSFSGPVPLRGMNRR